MAPSCTCPPKSLVHSVHCPAYVEPRFTSSVHDDVLRAGRTMGLPDALSTAVADHFANKHVRVPVQSAPVVPLVTDASESLPINAGNVQVLLNLLWPGNRFVVSSVEHDGEVTVSYRNGRAPNVVRGRLGEPVLPLLLAVQKALRRHGSDLL